MANRTDRESSLLTRPKHFDRDGRPAYRKSPLDMPVVFAGTWWITDWRLARTHGEANESTQQEIDELAQYQLGGS
ncbi:MAG TPA: hypothetical protein VGS41_07480 [Chthonomonadales bacterium]|nr:hypothetical protein [Chthonomonadales bacterium]